MRELDCDFCGSPAAGAYEVGPKPPDRSPTDRRRLVLCTDCRETLAVAIQPLLDRVAAAESDASPGDGGVVNTPSTDDSSSANTPSTDDGEETHSDERIVSNEEPNTERLTGDDDTTDASGGETSTVESGTTETESETGEAGSETAETESETPETTSETPETTSETTQAGHTATDPRRNGTADRPTTDSDDDESASEEQTDRGDSPASSRSSESSRTGGEPPEFRRVMRLLNNRTFPVDRAEFTDLATGAYGLAESEVDRIVEYAVQRGVLAVEDGELRRG